VHYLGLVLADFGREPRSIETARAVETGEIFVVVVVVTTLPISRPPNFTKFEHNTSIGVAMNPFGT